MISISGVDGRKKTLGAELEAIGLLNAARASPAGNIPVDESVGSALSGELSRCDCEHVGSAAETIREK